MADPNMKKSYSDIDGTVGFIYAWDGNKEAGKGEQESKTSSKGNASIWKYVLKDHLQALPARRS